MKIEQFQITFTWQLVQVKVGSIQTVVITSVRTCVVPTAGVNLGYQLEVILKLFGHVENRTVGSNSEVKINVKDQTRVFY